MMEPKKRMILDRSSELFFNYGISAVSIDDIASKCGVSEKTIYSFFENKEDLLQQVIELKAVVLGKKIKKIQQERKSALEELRCFFYYMNRIIRSIPPSFDKELKKYHSSKTLNVLAYKKKIVLPFMINNIDKGKRQGIYKNDIDAMEIFESYDSLSKEVYVTHYSINSQQYAKSLEFLCSLFLYRVVSRIGWEHLNGMGS